MITFNSYKISQTPSMSFGNEKPKPVSRMRISSEVPANMPKVNNNMVKSLKTFIMGTAATAATIFGSGCTKDLPFDANMMPQIDDTRAPLQSPIAGADSIGLDTIGVKAISVKEFERQMMETPTSKKVYDILDKMNVRALDNSIQTGKVAPNSIPYALDSLAYRTFDDNKLVQIKMDYMGSSKDSTRMLISVGDIANGGKAGTKNYIGMAYSNGEQLGLKLYNATKNFAQGGLAKETSLGVVDGSLNVGKSAVVKSGDEAGKYLVKMLNDAATKAVKVDWVNCLYKSPMILK